MSKKRAFITGINGQDGSYLAEFLLEKGYEVHGIIRRASTFNTERIDHLMSDGNIFNKTLFIHYGDLTDSSNLNTLISSIKPDEVYNLGAQSHVKVSFEIPENTADIDGVGCLRLLEAIRQHCPKCKFYQASTSEMFGGQKDEIPENGFNENSFLHPRSPYGVAKLFAHWITRNYRESYNLFACSGFLFNHESPRRGKTFVTRKITCWLNKFMNASSENQTLYIGNLDAYRDWGHAKDYVEAQWLMLQQDKPDDYVIATGETYSVRQFIEECLACVDKKVVWEGSGINEVGIIDGIRAIQVHERFFRPAEVDILLGDSSKARKILKWQPRYSFKDLVRDMVKSDVGLSK